MRYALIVAGMLSLSAAVPTTAIAQVSISIGINLPLFPELVRVPGYPVYYAPRVESNFFFYDGMYWVYQEDNWYASSWYNGPWAFVAPEVVPLFVLRVPVRYYQNPPGYFRGWRPDAPPRWGDHWGNDWVQQRSGWDKWNRRSAPAPAPLPAYQKQYSGERYPHVERQRDIHNQNYHYQPRDALVRQHAQKPDGQRAPGPFRQGQQVAPQERMQRPQDSPRAPAPRQQLNVPVAPRSQSSQQGAEAIQRTAPTESPARQRAPAVQEQRQSPRQGAAQHEQQAPASSQGNNRHDRGGPQEPGRGEGRGQENERDSGEGRGRGRDR